jgi:hypothetical protein
MMNHKGYTNFDDVYKNTCMTQTLVQDGMYLFNYDGNIRAEQEAITEFVGVEVNLVKYWGQKCKS